MNQQPQQSKSAQRESEPSSRAPLTFVTVVFEPEVALLRLQARSLARFLDAESVAAIIVLDNCAGGMGRARRRTVLAEFGPTLAPRVTFTRTRELGVETGAEGWRSQQAAKLLIARIIPTPHYVILDAKHHLIAPADAADFVDAHGRARGGSHAYTEHPLRADLERTLRYLGADENSIVDRIAEFPQTQTPFVIDTGIARRMLDDVERSSNRRFGDEFERARLLEFFLYSGWSMLRGDGAPISGETVQAPTIWPGHADQQQAAATIQEAEDSGAAWFGVHRRALARADAATRQRIAALWVDRGLLEPDEARRFISRFRLVYVPMVARARLAERLSRFRRR